MNTHESNHEARLVAMSNIECSIAAILEGDGFAVTGIAVPTAVWDRLVSRDSTIKCLKILGANVTHDPSLPTPQWCFA